LRTMFLNKLKTVSLAILLFGVVTGGVGLWAHWTPVEAGQPSPLEKTSKQVVSKEPIQPAPDFPRPVVENDPLAANQSSSKNAPDPALFGDPIPDGQQVIPMSSTDTIALAYSGKAIGTIAAYSAYTGEWSSYELVNPVKGSITPLLGTDGAIYQTGNDFYAFSSPAGKWGLLRLPADPKALATVSPKFIQVWQGNRMYVFSLKAGKWSKGVTITQFREKQKNRRNPEPAKKPE
jgi:hypothetical protein